MGKSGTPVNHALNRGIAAYTRVVRSKDEVPEAASPASEKVLPAKPPGKKNPPGLLKTGVPQNKSGEEKTGTEKNGRGVDGIDEARRLLHAAMGPEKGEAFLRKTIPEAIPNPFDFLEDFSGKQLALFFRDESAAAEALALSRLPPALTAETLKLTGSERKSEIVKRIARMGEISPEVWNRASAALREKVRRFGVSPQSGKVEKIDGLGALTAILKAADVSFGGKLLEELEKESPGLSRVLGDRLYTLDDVAAAPDRVIEEKLRTLSDRDIILLLKNRKEAFTKKIITNLPRGREERLREEAGYMGPAAKIEVEAASRDFLSWFRAEGPWVEEEEAKDEDSAL